MFFWISLNTNLDLRLSLQILPIFLGPIASTSYTQIIYEYCIFFIFTYITNAWRGVNVF